MLELEQRLLDLLAFEQRVQTGLVLVDVPVVHVAPFGDVATELPLPRKYSSRLCLECFFIIFESGYFQFKSMSAL